MKLNIKLLETYSPNHHFFTSREEIELVETNLVENNDLKNFSDDELKEIRDNVVEYYTEKMRGDYSRQTSISMMSVVAVIDNVRYQKKIVA